MNDDDFLWSAEEDAIWCSNLACGAGLVMLLAGFVFIQFVESAGNRCYVMTAAAIFGLMFIAIGIATRWWVHKKIKRTTIRRLGGGG